MPESPHIYRRQGTALGVPGWQLDRSIAAMAAADRHGVAPVLSLGHLAIRSGTSYAVLRRAIERSEDPYRSLELRRRDGRTMRPIAVPNPTIMAVQRWILDFIVGRLRPHRSSYAYTTGRSIRECAERHVGARWLVKLDLHDFFTSVDEIMVYREFRKLEYPPLASFELARLCTRSALFATHVDRKRYDRSNARGARAPYRISAYSRSGLIGFLPQGSPTSGALANLVMAPVDEALDHLASSQGLTYTRYSDDLTFSTSGSFDRSAAVGLIRSVRRILGKNRFVLHDRKVQVVPPGSRRIVLGLLVDGPSVRMTKDRKARITTHVRGVERFGLAAHVSHRGFRSVAGFVNHIDGHLAFARDIEPAWAAEIEVRWAAASAGARGGPL